MVKMRPLSFKTTLFLHVRLLNQQLVLVGPAFGVLKLLLQCISGLTKLYRCFIKAFIPKRTCFETLAKIASFMVLAMPVACCLLPVCLLRLPVAGACPEHRPSACCKLNCALLCIYVHSDLWRQCYEKLIVH